MIARVLAVIAASIEARSGWNRSSQAATTATPPWLSM